MDLPGIINLIRYYVIVIGFALTGALFWGVFAAVVARLAFDMDEARAYLFVGLPVAILFVAWIWKRLPKALGLKIE